MFYIGFVACIQFFQNNYMVFLSMELAGSFQPLELFSYSPSTKNDRNDFEQWKKIPRVSFEDAAESVKYFLKNLPLEG